jgi:hypothetical protein
VVTTSSYKFDWFNWSTHTPKGCVYDKDDGREGFTMGRTVNRRDSASHRHPQGLLLLRNHVPRDRFPLLIAPPYTTYTHTFMEIAKLKHFRCLTISRKISQTINGKVHTGQSVNNFITLTNLLPKPIDNFSSSSPSYRRKKINWKERYTRVL